MAAPCEHGNAHSGSINERNFLTSWVTLRRTLVHEVSWPAVYDSWTGRNCSRSPFFLLAAEEVTENRSAYIARRFWEMLLVTVFLFGIGTRFSFHTRGITSTDIFRFWWDHGEKKSWTRQLQTKFHDVGNEFTCLSSSPQHIAVTTVAWVAENDLSSPMLTHRFQDKRKRSSEWHIQCDTCWNSALPTGTTSLDRYNMIVYPKVSGLAAWGENCKWYSSLTLDAVVSQFCESV